MTQVDIYSMVDATNRDPYTALKKEKVIEYAQVGIGSILNAPFPDPVGMGGKTGWTATEWQIVLNQIKEIYRQHAKVPMIYGIDTIHGATYVRGATLFGQPLSAASSFNLDYVYKMGEIEAKDTLAAGISWIFSPVLGISTQPKWARVYETFGEDPYLSSQMGASIIRGIQSSGKVAACMKHFIGYSNPTSGLDRADSVINDWDLVNHYAPSFLAATKAGVKTAMETYASLNGVPVIGSHKLLIDLLRNDMKFQGMLVSDYSEVDRMFFEHHVASSVAQAVNISLTETSLDMNMGPVYSDFIHITEDLVRRKIIP
jgi:beta-glucosidase